MFFIISPKKVSYTVDFIYMHLLIIHTVIKRESVEETDCAISIFNYIVLYFLSFFIFSAMLAMFSLPLLSIIPNSWHHIAKYLPERDTTQLIHLTFTTKSFFPGLCNINSSYFGRYHLKNCNTINRVGHASLCSKHYYPPFHASPQAWRRLCQSLSIDSLCTT